VSRPPISNDAPIQCRIEAQPGHLADSFWDSEGLKLLPISWELIMTEQPDILTQFSLALSSRVAGASAWIAAIQLSGGRHLTGTLWQPDIIVTSEQSLSKRDEYELVAAGETVTTARIVGRDPATNIAALKLAQPVSSANAVLGEARAGGLVLSVGADARGRPTARLGVLNAVEPEWYSSLGGRIDQRIVVDTDLGRSEEGGPIFDVAGGLLGMSTFGPRRRVLAIPAATIKRIVPLLLKDGRIARGWLGAALQPVAVPDALGDAAGQPSGLMVMSLTDGGPAASAGILAGDIILNVDGASAHRMRNITARLGGDSIGRKVDLRFIRSGAVMSRQATITERPSS
jgi:S1-C subfamily serine protease